LTEEFAAPYYELAEGVIIDIATQRRSTTNWSKSEDPSAATEDTKRFDKDTELKAKLKETHKLADVKSLIMMLYFIQEVTAIVGFSDR
jgi:hypothetical protein